MPNVTPSIHARAHDCAATPAHGWLSLLSDRIRAVDPTGDLQDILTKLSESLDSALNEQNGMAEELLAVYEQLGIVFEVTHRLPTVKTESEVVDLFVDSLRQSFDRRAVVVMHPVPGGGWSSQGGEIAISDWIENLINEARERKAVVVGQPEDGMLAGCIRQVMVGAVSAGDVFVCAIVLASGGGILAFQASDMALLESLMAYCGDLIRNHRLVDRLREMSLTMVRSLVSTIDQKDEYTSGHSFRVGYYATLLARRIDLEEADVLMLQWSALLHDVGKIGIRDDVLKKSGKLTAEEWVHMKEHPVRSYEVVKDVPQLLGALDGILYHHEHYDGSGYPTGLKGEEIPLQARLIQIADVFDALTSNRGYRAAFDWRQALAILAEEAGTTVDPDLQGIFGEMMRELLEADPNAWHRLTEQALRFTQDSGDLAEHMEDV